MTAIGLGLWLVALVLTTARFTWVHANNGFGFASKRYEQAQLASLAADAKLSGCTVFASDPQGLNYWTDLDATLSPRKTERFSSNAVDDSKLLRTAIRQGRTCLVWIDIDPEDRLYTPEQLRGQYELTELARHKGAVAYEVRNRG